MSEGWIKLHRQLQYNSLWTCEAFTRGQAWVDLILLANHKEGILYVRGNKITVKRGQVGWSEKRLADRWRWSRTKVRKFLNDLEEEQQIRQQKNTITSLITLVSYDDYQKKEQQTEPQKDSRETAEEQQKDTNKNDKNEKNEKEVLEAWALHCKELPPVKSVSKTRKAHISARIKEFGLEQVLLAIQETGQSDFLRGEKTDFKASFDWLFKPTNMAKVLEGNYANQKNLNGHTPSQAPTQPRKIQQA